MFFVGLMPYLRCTLYTNVHKNSAYKYCVLVLYLYLRVM